MWDKCSTPQTEDARGRSSVVWESCQVAAALTRPQFVQGVGVKGRSNGAACAIAEPRVGAGQRVALVVGARQRAGKQGRGGYQTWRLAKARPEPVLR
jgi:hypothetical protein